GVAGAARATCAGAALRAYGGGAVTPHRDRCAGGAGRRGARVPACGGGGRPGPRGGVGPPGRGRAADVRLRGRCGGRARCPRRPGPHRLARPLRPAPGRGRMKSPLVSDAAAHLEGLAELAGRVAREMAGEVAEIAELVLHALVGGGKLMFCGNGGSAADAQHLAAEYVVRFRRARLPFSAIALTTDTSILTAA